MTLKDKILNRFKNSHEHISGQDLADEFGVSRAAVWKAVKQLKDEGYEIDSVSNKGYRITKNADTLSSEKIENIMSGASKNLTLYVYDSIDSTNNEAKRMLADGFEENALIVSNEQTNGRGRLGRSFFSPKNTGIYMSFLLQTSLKLSDAVTITTAAAVAVVRAIEKVTGIVPEIKWVNDVYVSGKKICGILTEAVSDFETGTAKSVIIGIGINISTEDFPEEIKASASSLGTGNPVRNEIIAETSNELLKIWNELPNKANFIETYKSHSWVLGKDIDYYINNRKFSGTAVDVDDNGGLVVRSADGSMTTLSSGEVTVRLSE